MTSLCAVAETTDDGTFRCLHCVQAADDGRESEWIRTWSATEQDLNRVGRAVFVEIDLDAIADNFGLLRAMCRNKQAGTVITMVY